MKDKDLHQLKNKIYEQVNQIDDETSLQLLQEAAAAYNVSSGKDILDELTPEQLSRLKESIQQANEGKTLTHEEVMKKAKQWLSR